MKSVFQLLIVSFIILFLNSCGPSQRENAVVKMNDAQKNIEKGDTLKAIEILESIPALFPKAKVQITVSKSKADELYRQLIDTKKEQLKATENQIAVLEKNFIQEKTEFDSYVQYIPAKQSFNRSWNRSFLQVNLDERGEIFLTSHYMGKDWLKHTAIKVYDGGIEVKTPDVPLDDQNNRKSDFLEYKWEKVTYYGSLSDSTIRFIAKHINRQLKCVFMGTNYYYIILEDSNKEAIRDAYNLSVAIKNKTKILRQIKELEEKRK